MEDTKKAKIKLLENKNTIFEIINTLDMANSKLENYSKLEDTAIETIQKKTHRGKKNSHIN